MEDFLDVKTFDLTMDEEGNPIIVEKSSAREATDLNVYVRLEDYLNLVNELCSY